MPLRPLPLDRLDGLLDAATGLTAPQAARRQAQFGFNDVVEEAPGAWRDLVRDTAADPMLWFLAGVSALFFLTGETTEAIVLLTALIPLAGMDLWLHMRTQASTRGLSSRLAATARVVRDGSSVAVPAREVVVGDLVEIGSGEGVPADGVWVGGTGLQADESVLTGEAWPAAKSASPLADGVDSLETGRWGFAGTRLLAGSGRLRVLHVGAETVYGEIVRSARSGRKAPTPLQGAVERLVAAMLGASVVLCVALAALRLAQGHGVLDAFMAAATLAVAALPEEFPVAFTLYLGVGVYRLARRKALVRRAAAVENIGRVTTICTDKTGTLTEGRLALVALDPSDGVTRDALGRAAALCAGSDGWDPLDAALVEALEAPPEAQRLRAWPFTEDRRKSTVVVRDRSGREAIVKGAPETVFELCGLTGDRRARLTARIEAHAAAGRKVIACASRPLRALPRAEPSAGFRLLGLLAFEDPLRDGAAEAVAACREGGLRVIMITGDHPSTARSVAEAAGLGGRSPRTVEAEALRTGEPGLAQRLSAVDVVARATPSGKLEIVVALKDAGEVVAVTGDGVNDVPALQAADVGVCMGERGSQAARSTSAIVLLDDNFRTLVGAIAEGRRLFTDLRLSFAYLLLVHGPLVLAAAAAPLTGDHLLLLPLHIVWLELLIHPTALLAFQSAAAETSLKPQRREPRPRFFGPGGWTLIAVSSAVLAALVTATFDESLAAGQTPEHARAVAIFALIAVSSAFAAVLTGLRGWTAKAMVAAGPLSFFVLAQVPQIARLAHLSPLQPSDLLPVAAAAAAAAAFATLLKGSIGRFRRGPDSKARSEFS